MKQRLITAGIMCIIFIPLIIIGKLPFEIAVAILSCLGVKELIDRKEKDTKIPLIIKIFSILSVGLLTFCSDALLPCLALIILLIFIPMIFIKSDEYNYEVASFLYGSIVFVGIGFYTISNIRIRSLDEFLYLLLITVLTDSFAYIGGKLIGKHKLIPRVSPNKTIEGSIIGTIVGIVIPSIYYLFMIDPGLNMFIIITITLLISVLSQLGDLLFSSIKRYYKVKDFSNLFPGHGGILDRFDSLLVASIVYTIIKTLFL